jgi:hypothetical protein
MASRVENAIFSLSKVGPDLAEIGAGCRCKIEHNARPLENPMRRSGSKGNNGLERNIRQRGKIGIR